jgi:hypothetical protein
MGNCCGNEDNNAPGNKRTVSKTEDEGYFEDKEIVEEE